MEKLGKGQGIGGQAAVEPLPPIPRSAPLLFSVPLFNEDLRPGLLHLIFSWSKMIQTIF